MTCPTFWGSHGCDRKAGHQNPLCKCGNHSFLDFPTGTVLQKSEIAPFLRGEKVGMPSGGYWRTDGTMETLGA